MLAFQTNYGPFEPLVMQYGMMNQPEDFKSNIIHIIREALDNFVSTYQDDTLIYSN
jgi:hypothetical protein